MSYVVPYDQQVMSEGQKKILEVLKAHNGMPVTASKLSKLSGYKNTKTSEGLREAIRLLNITHMEPVVSTPKGYLYAIQRNQVRLYRERIMHRVNALLLRESKLREIEEQMEEKQ